MSEATSAPAPTKKRVVTRKKLVKKAPETGSGKPLPRSQPTVAPLILTRNVARTLFVDSNLSNFFWALLVFIASLIIFIQVLFWTPDHYNIPSTDDYRVIQLEPLSEQGDIQDSQVRDFVVDGIEDVLSLSHLQPKANMNDALDKFFTDNGRRDFVNGLQGNDDLEPLLSGRYATIARISTVPVIDSYRLTNGRFTWVYKLPVRWQWNDVATGENRYADIDVTVFVVRESRLIRSKGMAIDALVYQVVQ